jgi:hypothetical protein
MPADTTALSANPISGRNGLDSLREKSRSEPETIQCRDFGVTEAVIRGEIAETIRAEITMQICCCKYPPPGRTVS